MYIHVEKECLKKSWHNFSVLSLPLCKSHNKLFLIMQNMVENVKANCDLANETI